MLLVAFVPSKASPALVPTTVLYCASLKANSPVKVISPFSSIFNLSVPLVVKAICPLEGL